MDEIEPLTLFPVLDVDIVARVTKMLFKTYVNEVPPAAIWRAVRPLLLVDKTWNYGVNRHLLKHIEYLRTCSVPGALHDWTPRRVADTLPSAQHSLSVANELLDISVDEPVAKALLRYTPRHPDNRIAWKRVPPLLGVDTGSPFAAPKAVVWGPKTPSEAQT